MMILDRIAGTIAPPPYVQEEVIVSVQDQTIIFLGFIIAVAAIFVYIARDMLLRKKTEYDKKDLESQKNKDYDKYHSDWNDDYQNLGERDSKTKKDDTIQNIKALPDLYAILKISKDATAQQIKDQYRQLAKQSHPDKNTEKDAKQKMAEINQAYEILSDPQMRKEYDAR